MQRFFSLTFLLLIFICNGYSNAGSLHYYPVNFESSFQHIADQALILEENEKEFSLQEILYDQDLQNSFQRVTENIPYKDFTSSTYWMKFNLKNELHVDQELYLEMARPITNVVQLYVLDEHNKIIEEYLSGDEIPFYERPLLYREIMFPILLEKGRKLKFVAKISSDGEVLTLPIKLWKADQFTVFNGNENFFLGMFYGLLFFVVVIFSFFGFALKQKLYAYFVSYVIFLILLQLSLDGLAFQYLWPNSIWWANHAVVVFATVSVIALLIYVRIFLNIKSFHTTFIKIYNSFFILLFICLILTFTSGKTYALSFPFINILAFLSSFLFLAGIYLKYKEEGKINIYFAIAFLCVLSGGVLFILSNTNILSSDFLVSNALKVGSGFEVIFLSIAMASQYREIKLSEEEARENSLINLKRLNELKVQQNVMLESEVKERTLQLQQSNEKLSTKNSEIIESITYAQRLQDAILPTQNDLDKLFPHSFVVHLPKDIVSGDFYWTEKIGNDTFFAVADCTGHGVPGAMVSVLGFNSLNRCLNEFNLKTPSAILDKLTELIEKTFDHYSKGVPDGMDISLCKWDGNKTLEYAGANNPLYLIRDDELIEYKANKQPIGSYEYRQAFTNHTIELKSGDSIYLSTDGYADQFGGPKDKKFLYGKFKKLLLSNVNETAETQKQLLEVNFYGWKENKEQVDDICIMGIFF